MKFSDFNGKTITKERGSYIAKRMLKIHQEMDSDKMIILTLDDSSLLLDALKIKADKIVEQKDSIPDAAFGLFTNDQIKGIRISVLPASKCTNLFVALDEQEFKERYALFSDDDVVGAINKQMLPTEHLGACITNEQKKKVKISQVNYQTINAMFPENEENEEQKKIFAIYDPAEVQGALEKDLMWSYVTGLISSEQMKAVKLSKLSVDTINNRLFKHKDNNEEDKKRFACIEPVEVQGALERLVVDPHSRLDIHPTDEGSEIVQIICRYDQSQAFQA